MIPASPSAPKGAEIYNQRGHIYHQTCTCLGHLDSIPVPPQELEALAPDLDFDMRTKLYAVCKAIAPLCLKVPIKKVGSAIGGSTLEAWV